ncbi:hypothetical protein [Nocardiopsis halotolerans]|uniref:hypothetical protein n=1 Tax=Nocardiopsis halotolerans TaxID=124252 RepID=UPI0012694481|nr:hypothetical protein [Nocardiopsis halotolerans]
MKDSLSREMVQDNPVMLEDLDLRSNELGLEEIARRGDLWDVTRMISNEVEGGDAQRRAVLQILGAAVAIVNKNNTRSQEGVQGEPHWIFTTTSKMRAFIEWGGMRPVGVLSDGRLVDRKGKRERILVCTLSANEAFGSVLKKVGAEKDGLAGGEGRERSHAGEIAVGCKKISGASGGV